MEGRYKKHGWFQEPERHSLARQGIKTKMKPIGLAAGKAVFGFIDTAAEGLRQEEQQPETDIKYEPVTIASINDLEETKDKDVDSFNVMSDVDSIVATSEEEAEPSEPIVTLPEEQVIPEYSSGVNNEVIEIEIAMEGTVVGSSWFDKAKDYLTEKIKDSMKHAQENNPDALSSHVGEIEAHKELLGDKINIIEDTKKKVMSAQYREEVGVQKQLESVGKLNQYIEQLRGEISNTEHKVLVGKKQLEHIRTMPVELRKSSGGLGVFPSLGEILNPFSMIDGDKEKTRDIQQRPPRFKEQFKEKRESLFENVFPSFDEILHPDKIRK